MMLYRKVKQEWEKELGARVGLKLKMLMQRAEEREKKIQRRLEQQRREEEKRLKQEQKAKAKK